MPSDGHFGCGSLAAGISCKDAKSTVAEGCSVRWRRLVWAALLMLVAFTLAGCGARGKADPVTAVVSAMRLQYSAEPTVRATFPAGNGTIVIFAFEANQDCYLGAMLAEPRNGKWEVVTGTTGSNHCPGSHNSAISTGGVAFGGPFTWSIAKGAVFDRAVSRIQVEWSDGVVTTAVVTNDIYYSYRAGAQEQVTTVRAYDNAGRLVSTAP